VLPVTGEIRNLVGASTDEIFEAAVRGGMTTLREDGRRSASRASLRWKRSAASPATAARAQPRSRMRDS
jgi:hypothetical protein